MIIKSLIIINLFIFKYKLNIFKILLKNNYTIINQIRNLINYYLIIPHPTLKYIKDSLLVPNYKKLIKLLHIHGGKTNLLLICSPMYHLITNMLEKYLIN